jgi:hypothetical protein
MIAALRFHCACLCLELSLAFAHMITDFRTLTTELWVHHILSSVLLGIFDIY